MTPGKAYVTRSEYSTNLFPQNFNLCKPYAVETERIIEIIIEENETNKLFFKYIKKSELNNILLQCSNVKDLGIIVVDVAIISSGLLNDDVIIQKKGKKKTNNINNKDKLKKINFILFSLIIFFGCH